MKKIALQKLIFALFALCMLTVFSSCNSTEKQDYYSQKENYINATGTITHIAYSADMSALYLGFSELTPAFDDTCFKIVGNNLSIVRNNGIDAKIKIGDQVEFITAPKYFGDGYVMPIVAMSANGENLLEFEEGITNLLDWFGAR